jgi:hypothetical protein
MNLSLSIASGASGIAMVIAGILFKDIAASFNGVGAITIAVVLYQISDMRKDQQKLENKIDRLENFIFDKAKMNKEG